MPQDSLGMAKTHPREVIAAYVQKGVERSLKSEFAYYVKVENKTGDLAVTPAAGVSGTWTTIASITPKDPWQKRRHYVNIFDPADDHAIFRGIEEAINLYDKYVEDGAEVRPFPVMADIVKEYGDSDPLPGYRIRELFREVR